MDADQILATGGMGGATAVIVFAVYKVLRQGIRSKCCGQTIEVGLQTPKNIEVKVDEAQGHTATEGGHRYEQRPQGSPVCENQSRARGEGSSCPEGNGSSHHQFERENPLAISIPKSLQ
jgi:hypothetical protein